MCLLGILSHRHSLFLKNVLHSSRLHNRCAHKQSAWRGVACKNMMRHSHTHVLLHNNSLVYLFSSTVCVSYQLAKTLGPWTGTQRRHTYRRREVTDRVQLARMAAAKAADVQGALIWVSTKRGGDPGKGSGGVHTDRHHYLWIWNIQKKLNMSCSMKQNSS